MPLERPFVYVSEFPFHTIVYVLTLSSYTVETRDKSSIRDQVVADLNTKFAVISEN
jgi:hypothetical protein